MKTTQHNIPLDFEQKGAGPAILFIHDSPDNRAIADPRFTALVKAGFRIVLTNLRGLAQCGEATVDDLTGDAVALLNYLGIGRAVVFGIGRGGCVLLDLLEKHPERIAASSLVIPPAMAVSLQQRFAGRNGLLETLRTESAAPLLRELFSAVPTPGATTPSLTELPALRTWIDQIAKWPQHPGKSGLALLFDLQLPLLLIDTPTSPAGRRWRQRLGGRLRTFNGSLLSLLDLLVPGESEEFDEEVFGESH
jgi:pimeloyl-ACP methyl ester carboxylesterase